MSPLVSVVIPVYNGERFLPDALDSIAAQTLQEFECIVVDDASTDGTARIVAEYASRDARFRGMRHDRNHGASAAYNTGIRAARAPLVAILDHDDVATPDRLARQAAFLAANPDFAAVGGALDIVDVKLESMRSKQMPTNPGLVSWSMLFFFSMAHPSIMMRVSAWEAVGGYSTSITAAHDYDLLVRMSRQFPIANLAETVLKYRWWGGNMTSRRSEVQDAEAASIVQQHIFELTRIRVSADEVLTLRGLARDRYVKDRKCLLGAADVIEQVLPVYLERIARTAEDRNAITVDAGVRLLQLAAITARIDAALSADIAARAVSTSPASTLKFGAKATRRLLEAATRS